MITSRERITDGFLKIDKIIIRHGLFNGEVSPELTRELLIGSEVACILPYDPCSKLVVLVEQFRMGRIDKEEVKWSLELPAGRIESGEDSKTAAIRELKEETGLEPKDIFKLLSYFPSPAISTEYLHIFLAFMPISTDLNGALRGDILEDEDIRLRVLTFEEAYKGIETGLVSDGATINALLRLKDVMPNGD